MNYTHSLRIIPDRLGIEDDGVYGTLEITGSNGVTVLIPITETERDAIVKTGVKELT